MIGLIWMEERPIEIQLMILLTLSFLLWKIIWCDNKK